MPRIRITTEPRVAGEVAVVLDERIAEADLTSRHFTQALVDRLRWAIGDAQDVERDQAG